MRVKIQAVKPNPFRDFELDPILDEQVARLEVSHEQIGQFGAIPVRPHPTEAGAFQQAAGHHNIAAMRNRRDSEVNVECKERSDDEMVRLLALENLTQRQHNAGALADAVFARARIIARRELRNDSVAQSQKEASRHSIFLSEGPGERTIYAELNGFSRDEKKEAAADGLREVISMRDVRAAIGSLKASGRIGTMMAELYAEIEEAHEAERLRLEEEERAAAEAARQAEEERQAREAEAERKAEEAKRKAKEAEERAAHAAQKEKERAEHEAKEAREKAKAAEERRAQEAEKAKQERKVEAKEKEERAKKSAASAEKAAKEKTAIDSQRKAAVDPAYDVRCVGIFDWPQQEQAFRKVVLSENGRRFIPKTKQFELAQDIKGQIVTIEKKRGMRLGSDTVEQLVRETLIKAMGMQRDIDAREKADIERGHDIERVRGLWATFRRGLQQAEAAMEKLADEEKKWPYDKALFPIDRDAIRTSGWILERIKKINANVGGRYQ